MVNLIGNFIGYTGNSSGEAFSPDVETFDKPTYNAFSIPVSVALRDSFDGTAGTSIASHSPETGGAWSRHPFFGSGTAVLSGNSTIYGNDATADKWFLSATSALSESYEISYKLKIHTTIFSSAVYCGVVFDSHATEKTGYQLMFVPTSANTGSWVLQKMAAGVATNMTVISGVNAGVSYADGTELDVRGQIDRRYIGNSGVNEDVVYFRLWVNGVKQCEWKDDAASILSSTKRTCVKFVRDATSTTGHHLAGLSIQDLSYSQIVSDTVRVPPSTAGTVVTIRGTRTAWDVHQPVFLVSGATKTAQSITNYSTATITLTTGADPGLITITDPSTGSKVKLSIANNSTAPMLSGWSHRKQFKVSGSTSGIGVQTNYLIPLTIHTGSGTDSGTDVYIGSGARSDWGDIRITDRSGQTRLPFAIMRKEASYINVLIWAPIINYAENSFFLYWGKPASAGSVYKIACLTDQHYDPEVGAPDNRNDTLDFIDNFVELMEDYAPDLAVNNGDKTGASLTDEATQLEWYQDVMDHFAPVSAFATEVKEGVAPGNHDFEYPSFAGVLALHSADTWMESGVLYGSWESDDYKFISLDANYDDADDSHLSIDHHGYGWINATQLTWLASELSSATKPVIVFCHQPLSEMDTEQFTLTREVYHTKNREKVRKILEDSGKVVCCIHGHVHYHRTDVINGIPYMTMGNLTYSGNFGELVPVNVGNYSTFEFDADARTINFKRMAIITPGTAVTVYESDVPFGITSFWSDVADFPELIFPGKAMFERASIFRDPTQLYATDDAYLYKYPSNRNTPDAFLSDRTIRIEGRADNPNYGRPFAHFQQQRGKFKVEFNYLAEDQVTKYFRFYGDTNTSPGPYLAFHTDGNIKAYNGASLTSLRTYTVDTWYKVEMIIDVATDIYSVYIDGVLEAEDFAFNNTQTLLRQMDILTEDGFANIDNLHIRPYVSPEPTLEFV